MTAHPRRLRRFRFLRSLRPSDTGATADAAIAMDLDRQLDAWVTGTPAPAPLTSRASDEHARLAGLTSTFQQVAAMDATTREPVEFSTAHAKAIIWEDIMSATTAIPSSSRPSDTPEETTWTRKRVERSLPQAARSKNSTLPLRSSRWLPTLSPVLNVAMVAIMVLTLGFGAFTITGGGDRRGLGGNGDDAGNPQVLASPPTVTESTPSALESLPTAADCQASPLTINQVMMRIERGRGRIAPIFQPRPETLPLGGPDQHVLDDIAGQQREFLACVMRGNLFQIWTFISPDSTYWNSILGNYGAFVSEETVRADLERLQALGDDPFLERIIAAIEGSPDLITNLGLPGDTLPKGTHKSGRLPGSFASSIRYVLPLIDRDPATAKFVVDDEYDRIVTVSIVSRESSQASEKHLSASGFAIPWQYIWDEPTQRWLIWSFGRERAGT